MVLLEKSKLLRALNLRYLARQVSGDVESQKCCQAVGFAFSTMYRKSVILKLLASFLAAWLIFRVKTSMSPSVRSSQDSDELRENNASILKQIRMQIKNRPPKPRRVAENTAVKMQQELLAKLKITMEEEYQAPKLSIPIEDTTFPVKLAGWYAIPELEMKHWKLKVNSRSHDLEHDEFQLNRVQKQLECRKKGLGLEYQRPFEQQAKLYWDEISHTTIKTAKNIWKSALAQEIRPRVSSGRGIVITAYTLINRECQGFSKEYW
jgi:hypothetical protein